MAGIKVINTKPMKLAYLEHTGDYKEIPYEEYFNTLFEWAKENKVRPGFKPLGIFHDNPLETPPEECKSEIALPIVGDAEPDEKIKIKELPSMEVAFTKHKGTSDEYQETYNKIQEWIKENGYEWAGPSMEIYTKKPKVKGDKTILFANIQVPIKKAEKTASKKLRKLAEEEDTKEEEVTEVVEVKEEE